MYRRYSLTLLLVCQLIIWIGYKNPLASTLLGPITLPPATGVISLNKTDWAKRARSKRDIWQLYGVITCMTPCDPFVLKDYGCYCGLGGTGRPVDHIDKCCMFHDYCYHNTPCHQALTYFLPYNWKCIAGRPYCSNLEAERWPHTYSCSARLCECDRMFSECINAYGCPTHKAVCKSSQIRRVWQKFLIKIGIG